MKNIQQILDLITEKGIFSLSNNYEGACPCFDANLAGIIIEIHCWRTNKYYAEKNWQKCKCKYSGLHVSQEKKCYYKKEDLTKIGKLCLKQIKETWGSATEFNLVIE